MKLSDVAASYAEKISDEKIKKMFVQCFMSTFETTAQAEFLEAVSRRTEVAEKDCGKIRLAEESKTAERTKIKNA